MPRKAWRVLTTKTRVSDVTRRFLETGDRPAGHLGCFTLEEDPAQLRTVWSAVGELVLADWIAAHPCSRPWAWWLLEAPEPRRRTGGIGAAIDDLLAIVSRRCFGIPTTWVCGDVAAAFDLPATFDPADPPRYESQAAYLARLGRLTPAERQHLSQHQDLMRDEPIAP